MRRELHAAILYAIAGFGMGFLLGPLREFLLVPALGRLLALGIELPLLLGFCFWIAPRILRHRPQPPGAARLRMGVAALALVLLLDFILSVTLRGWDLREWFESIASLPGLVTLGAYLIFALIPFWSRGPAAPV